MTGRIDGEVDRLRRPERYRVQSRRTVRAQLGDTLRAARHVEVSRGVATDGPTAAVCGAAEKVDDGIDDQRPFAVVRANLERDPTSRKHEVSIDGQPSAGALLIDDGPVQPQLGCPGARDDVVAVEADLLGTLERQRDRAWIRTRRDREVEPRFPPAAV